MPFSILVAHFKEKNVNEAIFATEVDPKWEQVAERIRTEMEQWWQNTEKNPKDILEGMGDSLKNAKVLTNRNFKTYIKYVFDYSELGNHQRIRMSVLEELKRHHTNRELTNLFIEAKAEGETNVIWKVKSDKAIDLQEILKLGSSQDVIALTDAWISYISAIIGPTCLDHGGCNAITMITSTFEPGTVLDKLKLALQHEKLKENAMLLLHEIFDQWAYENNLVVGQKLLEYHERKVSKKVLVDALAEYVNGRHTPRVT